MRKIVQLDEYDYNKLADLAKLNEKEIEKHAIDLWKEKGVAEITIKIDTGRDYNDYCRIDCSTYLFYKDNRFYIPENVRERFRKIVKENVMWDIEERFGDLKGAINKFNREAKWIGYTKFVLYMIALSGWAVAAVLPFFVTIGNIFSLLITWSFIPFLQLFQDYFHTVIQPFLIAGHMFTYVVNQTSYNNKDNP